MREKIRDSDIVCGHCKKLKLIVTEGSETKEMLQCEGCGQYYYLMGRIRCCCYIEDDEELWIRIAGELVDMKLLPSVLEHIQKMQPEKWLK